MFELFVLDPNNQFNFAYSDWQDRQTPVKYVSDDIHHQIQCDTSNHVTS